METYDNSLAARFMQLLARREAELSVQLGASAGTTLDAGEAAPRDVVDFKDLASQDMLDTVDEAKAEHAETELQQVLAARLRLQDGSYGICLNCGKPIDLHRLTALPAAPYCIACQTAREKKL